MRQLATLLGPTAGGKSAVAMILARRFGAEILSVDSMQVYRGMDIGTAKPTVAERTEVRHHMIDVADPADPYTVAEFQRDARQALAAGTAPLLVVGGSGLHFRALVDPLTFAPADAAVRQRWEALGADQALASLLAVDPAAGEVVDLANPRRVIRALEIHELTGETPTQRAGSAEAEAVRAYQAQVPFVGLAIDPGEHMAQRVTGRFAAMMDAGLLDEVAGLAGRLGITASQAAGYREMLRVVAGDWTVEEATRRAVDATTSLARRQRTYLRRDPRLEWLEWDDDSATVAGAATARLEEAGWNS